MLSYIRTGWMSEIMCRDGRYQQNLADDFDNLTRLKLPPYAPELDPIELVWQWLCQYVLANLCFSSYDDKCSIAWNIFIAKKLREIEVCHRQ